MRKRLPLLLALAALSGILAVGLRVGFREVRARTPESGLGGDAGERLDTRVLDFGGTVVQVLSDSSLSASLPTHTVVWGPEERLDVTRDLEGKLQTASVCDLDHDGELELALWATSAGSGSYADFLLLERTREGWVKHSLGELPASARSGYMGHERIAVLEDSVEVRFPLYLEGEPNSRPSGGRRCVRYALGEGGLRVCEVVDVSPEVQSQDN